MKTWAVVAVTAVASWVVLALVRACWLYASRVNNSVLYAERFEEWAKFRWNEYSRLADEVYELRKRLQSLESHPKEGKP